MKKNFLSWLLAVALIFTTIPVQLLTVCAEEIGNAVTVRTANTTDFAGGEGTAENPYLIETKEHLNNVRNHLDAHYKMIADIVFTNADFAEGGDFYNDGKGWEPIGSEIMPFSGVFDGNGKKIIGLVSHAQSADENRAVGLFELNTGKIHDLGMVDGSIEINLSIGATAGGIVGMNSGIIINCYNTGKIQIQAPMVIAGGIAGSNDATGLIFSCYSTGNITATSSYDSCVGGITARNGGIVSDCYNAGDLSGKANIRDVFIGGIVANNTFSAEGKISNCYNIGTVSGDARSTACVGAIAGDSAGMSFSGCYYLDIAEKGFGQGTGVSEKCTAEQLKQQSTYTDFDFKNIWEMSAETGYPQLMMISAESTGEFAGGNGTVYNPYLIETKVHLNNVRNHLDANFKLVRDIEFTEADFAEGGEFYNNGQGWVPMGTMTQPFTGILDGNGYNIKGLYCNVSDESCLFIGLFAYNKGTIQNLNIYGDFIRKIQKSVKDRVRVAAFSAYNFSGAIIKNCHSYVNINIEQSAGDSVECAGISAGGSGYTVTDCSNNGTIYYTGQQSFGLLFVGGIISTGGTVISSCNKANVIVSVGSNNTSGDGIIVGGIAAGYVPKISQCYNTGDINVDAAGTCSLAVSGISNTHVDSAIIDQCCNMGNLVVKRVNSVGKAFVSAAGIASFNKGTISNCYNVGTVSVSASSNSGNAMASAAGIGNYTGSLAQCYNIGSLFANAAVNSDQYLATEQVAALSTSSMRIDQEDFKNCYYLDTTEFGVINQPTLGNKVTLEQMKLQKTFSGFDFDTVWTMAGNEDYLYPELQNLIILDRNTSGFADGSGTAYAPYLIETKEQLNRVHYYLYAHFKLMADIEFTATDFAEDGDFYNGGRGWVPIGENSNDAFLGSFDGNGYTIKGLYVNISAENTTVYAGLFGYSKGIIQNLGLLECDISAAVSDSQFVFYAGGIVGVNTGTISNCYNTGTVSMGGSGLTPSVGGIAGYNDKGTIQKCYNSGTISAFSVYSNSGGIAGYNTGEICRCYNVGALSVSFSLSVAPPSTRTGGITGYNQEASVSECYNTGTVLASGSGASPYVGGIIGDNDKGTVSRCYNTGSVSAASSAFSVFSALYAGGIVGYTSGQTGVIKECYNIGSVSLPSIQLPGYGGGIVGSSSSGVTVSDCYNIGSVSASSTSITVGSIAGYFRGTLNDCYYLDTMSKGIGDGTDTAVKCTIDQMCRQETFVGFDFDTAWTMMGITDYLYPELQDVSMSFVKSLSFISLTKTPTKLKYLEGKDALDTTGGKLTLTYNNGTTEVIDLTFDMVTGFDNTKIGKQTLTVTYSGKTTTFEVEITQKALASISISKKPIKLEYLEGDTELDTTGMELILTYNNDSIETITGGWNTEYDFSTHGTKNVKVIYQGKETFFSVTVLEKSISEISIASQPTKQEYVVGEDLQTAGLTIKITYNNGTSATVSTGWSITGYDKNKIGTQTITVTYQGQNATFTVTVKSKVPNSITSSTYIVSGGYISKIPAGTTVNTLINGINEKQYIKVYKGNAEVSGNTKVGTGIIVKLMDGSTVKQSVTVVVTGDTNGDGDISITDMIAVKAQILGKSKFEGAVAKAADTNGDNGISITDFIQIKAHILGKSKIQAR